MMSSINDVAKLYDEFEEAFVDVMTAKSGPQARIGEMLIRRVER
jgi:hypothetical protein